MKNNNVHLLDNFPIIIYWQNEDYVIQGGNLEIRRDINELFHTKFALKRFIYNEQLNILGSIALQIPNFKLSDYPINNNMENNSSENNLNLDFIFDNAPVAFWIKDKNHVFLDGNPQAFRAAGVNSLEKFAGKTLLDFPKMKDQSLSKIQKLHAIEKQIIKTGEEQSHIEANGLCDSELTFMHQIAWAQRPILDSTGQVLGIAGASFFNDEWTRNKKFIVPESCVATFMSATNKS